MINNNNSTERQELSNYYETQIDLVNHPGWKDFLENVEQILDNAEDIKKINNVNDLFFQKGQIDILEWILSWGNLVQQGLDRLNADL